MLGHDKLPRIVQPPRSLQRSLAFAGGIVVVAAAAQIGFAILALSPAGSLALDALASAAALALAAAAIASLGGAPLAPRLGLGPGRLDGRRIALAALGLAGLSHAIEAFLELAGAASPSLARFDEALAGVGAAGMIFPLLALSLGSACGEELFFRGLLQRGIATRLGAAPAIAAAALAFGAAHGEWVHGGAAALLGGFLGLVAHAAGSIRPAIAAHALNNAVALVERVAEVELPSGPIATPALAIAGLTLACVAAAAMLRSPAPGLQSADRPSD
jgi:hypothetical protein